MHSRRGAKPTKQEAPYPLGVLAREDARGNRSIWPARPLSFQTLPSRCRPRASADPMLPATETVQVGLRLVGRLWSPMFSKRQQPKKIGVIAGCTAGQIAPQGWQDGEWCPVSRSEATGE